ncbi:unnamed protein product [Oppiella nova]|uniref:UBC core domain-containing protein n=1 Tax=Oppiella nova TaxID=334625 RepID=A0A7R9M7W1_9ACAR|nr:unnamed protein product [Oppiella nova]CAG2171113.1 unnamed protein product [Oppiella nova]
MAVEELAVKRLQKDYMNLLTDPVDNILAHPIEQNIFEWVYVLRGPVDTAYYGGIYYGKLVFPKEYPLRGPSIYMTTPSGKFKTNHKLCVSGISDMHSEKWSPCHTVSTILISLFSFMVDDKCGPFSGMDTDILRTPPALQIDKQRELAAKSWSFNLNDKTFCKYFPQLVEEAKTRPPN